VRKPATGPSGTHSATKEVDYSEPPAGFIAPLEGPSEIGCNENCFSIIEIGLEGEKLIYETTLDAACTG
jgi:hypothetical protein